MPILIFSPPSLRGFIAYLFDKRIDCRVHAYIVGDRDVWNLVYVTYDSLGHHFHTRRCTVQACQLYDQPSCDRKLRLILCPHSVCNRQKFKKFVDEEGMPDMSRHDGVAWPLQKNLYDYRSACFDIRICKKITVMQFFDRLTVTTGSIWVTNVGFSRGDLRELVSRSGERLTIGHDTRQSSVPSRRTFMVGSVRGLHLHRYRQYRRRELVWNHYVLRFEYCTTYFFTDP